MGTQTTWEYFGLPAELDGRDVVAATASRNGQRAVTAAPRRRWRRRHRRPGERDRAAVWLRVAMAALGLLAATAAAVSFQAQYVLVREVKTTAGEVIAAMQAAIPDAGALVFAALGIAMALCGRRALRARAGNVLCVGISLAMNAIASPPAPRALAVWIMPAALYAFASDTLIMVIRAHALARQQDLAERLADDDGEATPLAIAGAFCLWLLRLALAPWSTLAGFRTWVVEECPVAPGRTAGPKALPAAVMTVAALPAGQLRTSVGMGCPFCTVLDRESDGHCTGCGATDEQRAQAVLTVELDRALRAQSGGRRRTGRTGGGQRGRRDWDALSEAVRKRYTGAGITREAYESGADLAQARGHRP
jgi:hypothetical protein